MVWCSCEVLLRLLLLGEEAKSLSVAMGDGNKVRSATLFSWGGERQNHDERRGVQQRLRSKEKNWVCVEVERNRARSDKQKNKTRSVLQSESVVLRERDEKRWESERNAGTTGRGWGGG